MDCIGLRLAEMKDAATLQSIYAPFVRDTAVSFETEPPSVAEMARRIEEYSRVYPFIVAEADGEVAGFAYAHRQMEREAYGWNATLSIYLSETHTGRGLGRRLYGKLIDLLALQGVINLYALVVSPNPPSERLHRKLGFVLVGTHPATGYKFGRWHDVNWFWKQLPRTDPPAAVMPLSSVTDEAAAILAAP